MLASFHNLEVISFHFDVPIVHDKILGLCTFSVYCDVVC